jgi:hypothetical protein
MSLTMRRFRILIGTGRLTAAMTATTAATTRTVAAAASTILPRRRGRHADP